MFQYKLPEAELEKLLSAETEDAQRTILENFAKDLPIVTRYFFTISLLLESYYHSYSTMSH